MAYHNNPRIITDGLVLCLDAANKKSYPGTGTTWYDLSRYKNHGTLTNGPTFDGNNGGGFIFDGTNDYAHINSLDLSNTNQITIEIGMKVLTYPNLNGSTKLIFESSNNFNVSAYGFVAGLGDASSGVYQSTFPLSFAVNGNSGYNISYLEKSYVDDLNWHHLTYIFDKSEVVQETYLCVDGIFYNGNTTPYNANNTNNFGNLPFYIGCRAGTSFFANINISSIKVYNRRLSTSEIQQNYNVTKGRYGL